MKFEWDTAKNKYNTEKHHIAFEDAVEILLQAEKVVYESEQQGSDFKRFVAIGKLGGKHYAVIYTVRGKNIRIISARRARNEEKRTYSAIFGG